jgi:hypothetical protein
MRGSHYNIDPLVALDERGGCAWPLVGREEGSQGALRGWGSATRQALSASLDERVASDWHSRFAQSLAQGCSLPIPKGGSRGRQQLYATQHNAEATTQEATPQRYASLGHTSVRWPTLRNELPLRLPMREES